MEYASLRSLSECLRKPTVGRPMSVVLMCDFALQVADAMAYLENRRIVHRSLSARNVLMFAADKVCNYTLLITSYPKLLITHHNVVKPQLCLILEQYQRCPIADVLCICPPAHP